MLKTLFTRALTVYWLDKRTNPLSRTITDYEHVFARLVDLIGEESHIEGITANDIRRFLAAMRERRKLGNKSTINYQIALLSLLTWAERDLRIPHIIRRHLGDQMIVDEGDWFVSDLALASRDLQSAT